jgi:predicted AlkP superfamily phosphohydrolase/phosphomutase
VVVAVAGALRPFTAGARLGRVMARLPQGAGPLRCLAMARKAAVIGLDGSAWHLLDPLIENGTMPRLAALVASGSKGVLESTVPASTPPAWTSAITGVNPGRHGIYGFQAGTAQDDHQPLVHSGMIKTPTIWDMANSQDATCGVYNLPLSYPPQPLDRWMVSGMMTPGMGKQPEGFVYPKELESKILSWVPDYVVEMSANWEQDWRDETLAATALASLQQRKLVLERLLTEDPVDVLFAVLETPDRLQHVYYRYMDPNDELYDTDDAEKIRPAIERCFAAMDDIVGLVDDFAGNDGGILVCSDHGFTAWEVSVHVNALLAEWGYLKMKGSARALQSGAAQKVIPVARRVLPTKLRRGAKKKTLSAVDWAKTKAFAAPNYLQGVFVNVKGRERFGVVPESEVEAVTSDLVQRFKELKAPDGSRVTDHVLTAREAFGDAPVIGAPDVMPVLKNHRYELDDEVHHREAFTDLSHLPRGVHHPDGMVVIAGNGAKARGSILGSIMDVAPTLLYMADLAVPDGLDGKVLTDAFEDDHISGHPIQTTTSIDKQERDEGSPYSAEEEAAIEESLRGLGYI